jgi:hypothetical protein
MLFNQAFVVSSQHKEEEEPLERILCPDAALDAGSRQFPYYRYSHAKEGPIHCGALQTNHVEGHCVYDVTEERISGLLTSLPGSNMGTVTLMVV